MGNFAVSASEEIINQGNALLEKLQKPGDKKGDTLKHLFEIVEANIDTDQMQQGGIDTRKLDASLSNIRSMFVSMVGGQEEILASYQAKIDNIKALKDKLEEELTGKIAEARKAKEQLAGYDDLKKSEFENKTEVINLRHELSEKEKEYADALKSKDVECKHQIEQIQSSAELEKEKALIAKEREMNEKIRELDRENAKLQALIEQLQKK